ncbi:MAG: hypothetical protein L3J83_06945 [Proteobacteria bacterium]|nr:hypothetical protein [Pseudomonadota bacterium]
MKIIDFLEKDKFFKLPSIQASKEDYKIFVNRVFDQFIDVLEGVEQFDDIKPEISLIKERQKHLVKHLKLVIESYYNGEPASAFT